jgi:hypothetical protein
MLQKAALSLLSFVWNHIETMKVLGIIIAAWLAGEAAGAIDAATQHPAIISALVGGSIAIAIKLIDVWYESKKSKREGHLKEIATADKVLELEQADKQRLREEMRALSQEKELFYRQQIDRIKVELFDTRTSNHQAVNEVMRLYHIIIGLQRTMIENKLQVPEITFVPLTKFLIQSDDKNSDAAAAHVEKNQEVEKTGHAE